MSQMQMFKHLAVIKEPLWTLSYILCKKQKLIFDLQQSVARLTYDSLCACHVE